MSSAKPVTIVEIEKKLEWLIRNQDDSLIKLLESPRAEAIPKVHREWLNALTSHIKSQNKRLVSTIFYQRHLNGPFVFDAIDMETTKGRPNLSNWKTKSVPFRDLVSLAELFGLGSDFPKDSKTNPEHKDTCIKLLNAKIPAFINGTSVEFADQYRLRAINGKLGFSDDLIPGQQSTGADTEVNETTTAGPNTGTRDFAYGKLIVGSVSVAVVALVAAINFLPSVPSAFDDHKVWMECLPGGGPISVSAEPSGSTAEIVCPADGWVPLPDFDPQDDIQLQDAKSGDPIKATTDWLQYRFSTKTVAIMRPERSVSSRLLSRRQIEFSTNCPDGITSVELSNSVLYTLRCGISAPPLIVNVPDDANVTLTYYSASTVAQSCTVYLGHHLGTQMDLSQTDLCESAGPVYVPSFPLRPFLLELDVFVDPMTGLSWMRDPLRYGNLHYWNDSKSAQILDVVHRDTGADDWRFASRSEVESLLLSRGDKPFIRQVSSYVGPVLGGIATDTSCSTSPPFIRVRFIEKGSVLRKMQEFGCMVDTSSGFVGYWIVK